MVIELRRTIVLLFFLPCIIINSIGQDFYLGVDLSYVNEIEDCGVTYFDESNTETDVYELLSAKGANLVRLRLWHNPGWTNYSNYEDVKSAIVRAKAEGIHVLLDFHYSDFWADPSRQWCPAAWNNINDDTVMGDSVYNYTYNTLNNLASEGLLPEMVQIGNEINGNILIKRTTEEIDHSSPNMLPIDWSRQVSLLHRGIAAVQQINSELSSEIKTVIHIAQPENAEWWFRDAIANGLAGFDIIGISYYPQWSEYDVRDVGNHVKTMEDTYGKDVMVVEVGYPWTLSGEDGAGNVLGNDSRLPTYGNDISNDVQRDFLIELTYLIKENGGLGLIYWEPAWVSSSCKTYWATGSHYENAAVFDFNNKINSGADYLGYDYSIMPKGLSDQEVTFIVEMVDEETSNGTYITGSFTGSTWEFKQMEATTANRFQFDTTISGRTIGGYIYYNNNIWNDSYKENVPSPCAKMWDTHRQYVITNIEAEFAFTWGECTLIEESNSLNTLKKDLIAYPSPAIKYLNLNIDELIKNIQITNIQGQKFSFDYNKTGYLDIQALQSGLYVLKVETASSIYSCKFIKQ